MSFPKHLIGYGTYEKRRSWACNQLEKHGSAISYGMNLLAGFSECDRFGTQFIYESGRMPAEYPLEEILSINAWSMIIRNILHELKNNLIPNFQKVAELAINSRLGIEGAWHFPEITPEMALSDFDTGFTKVAEMCLGRFKLSLACLWLESALCHNGIYPFIVKKDVISFLRVTNGLLPNTVYQILDADRREFDHRNLRLRTTKVVRTGQLKLSYK